MPTGAAEPGFLSVRQVPGNRVNRFDRLVTGCTCITRKCVGFQSHSFPKNNTIWNKLICIGEQVGGKRKGKCPSKFGIGICNFAEPMNGSEHTVGGVGYAGEVHFIHRNLKYPNMAEALKQPEGVLGVAVFFNESHDDNLALIPLTTVLPNVTYSGTESGVHSLRTSQLIPLEKSKEFWLYEGSEMVEPFRGTVSSEPTLIEQKPNPQRSSGWCADRRCQFRRGNWRNCAICAKVARRTRWKSPCTRIAQYSRQTRD